MRIVGGMWRGKPLEAPDGRGTRPTTDRTRESIASMVLSAFSLDLSGVVALDAFAGSGALGFEMVSRGCERCTFVERDRRAAAVLKRNARSLGATASQARLQVGDFFKLAEAGALQGGPFSLVLLDPPYATPADAVSQAIARMGEQGQLAADTMILYERSADADGLELPGAELLRSKSRKTTAVDLLRLRIGGAVD